MTRPTPPPQLRLRDPADVLAAVPYLLGFHPVNSIVVLGLCGTSLVFHARCDLPPAEASSSEVQAFARYITDVLRAQGADGAILVGFGTPERADPTVRATARRIMATGGTIFEQLRAHDGRFWSYCCQDPRCCPPSGSEYDIKGTIVAAEATLAGFVALPDRDALVSTLGPPDGAGLDAIQRATAAARTRHEGLRPTDAVRQGRLAIDAAVERCARGGKLTDDELGWLTVSLGAHDRLLDHAIRLVDLHDPKSTVGATHIGLWTDVVRRCDPDTIVEPAVILAYASWRSGDGVRAGVSLDRALAADPECQSALLIAELLRRAVPPPGISRKRADADAPPRPRQGGPRRRRTRM